MATVKERGRKEWFRGWQKVTLRALAALQVTAGEVSNIFEVGDYDNLVILQRITSSATDATDTLDTKIDGSWDGVNFFNMGEFTQQAGNGSARTEMMQFSKGRAEDPNAIVDITADAGAAVTRPSMCPPFLRTTSVVVDANADASHTFEVIAYIQ